MTLRANQLAGLAAEPGLAGRSLVPLLADPGGEVVEEHEYPGLRSGSFTYDLASRGPQRYYLKVFVNDVQKFNKRIRVVDKLE